MRFLLHGRKTREGSAYLALVGIILGSACLVVAMSVMSGFEKSLQASMIDLTGHVQVVLRGKKPVGQPQLDEIVSVLPFLRTEALAAQNGKVTGVILQGIDPEKFKSTLQLENRLQKGQLDFNAHFPIWIGKGLAEKWNLQPGSKLRIILPVGGGDKPEQFHRKIDEAEVRAVLDFGKHEWNERFIISDLTSVQNLTATGNNYHGFLIRLHNAEQTKQTVEKLRAVLSPQDWISDWRELNENLFEAVRLERRVIFLVIFLIVLIAAMNITSTLFVSVIRKTQQISSLRVLGLTRASLLRVFLWQGLLLGLTGLAGGIILGVIFGYIFEWLQRHFLLMSGSVYKLDQIQVAFRGIDLAAISLATVFICVIAALIPALRSYRLTIMEGIRYG